MTSEDARGAALAAALVNTRPRPASPSEALAGPADVVTVLGEHGIRVTAAEGEAALPGLLRLREDLLTAFSARDMAGFAAALNPHLSRAPAPLLAAAGGGWAVRAEPDSLTDRVALATTRGLAELAAAHGLDRVGFCAANDCQCVFADSSPRGTRRFCSRTCANRINVRLHRARAQSA